MREYIFEVLPNNNIKLKITTDKPECINSMVKLEKKKKKKRRAK